MNKKILIAVLFALAACDNGPMSRVESVSMPGGGTVISREATSVEGSGGLGAGTAIGAGGGALAGALIGSSSEGKVLGATIGALAGGIAGHAIESRSRPGYRYRVQSPSGDVATVTSTEYYEVGQRLG